MEGDPEDPTGNISLLLVTIALGPLFFNSFPLEEQTQDSAEAGTST